MTATAQCPHCKRYSRFRRSMFGSRIWVTATELKEDWGEQPQHWSTKRLVCFDDLCKSKENGTYVAPKPKRKSFWNLGKV